jgi:hypothetical protein
LDFDMAVLLTAPRRIAKRSAAVKATRWTVRVMKIVHALLASLLFASAAAAVEPAQESGAGTFGDVIPVAPGVMVRPERVIEDSRCPQGTMCVWAGRLVIAATVLESDHATPVRLTLGTALPVAQGVLILDQASATRRPAKSPTPSSPRLHFTFTPVPPAAPAGLPSPRAPS